MHQEQLNAIKERVAKASHGPWMVIENEFVYSVSSVIAAVSKIGDVYFITHAREDVPTLIAEVERLREALSYYADTKHYEPYCIQTGDYASDVTEDNGEIARQALAGENK